MLVPANDSSLTLQTVRYEQVLTNAVNSKPEYEETDMPEEIIEKIRDIMNKGPIRIHSKEDVRSYLLLVFYMQKLNDCELQYLPASIAK